jgi:hypothetical protein
MINLLRTSNNNTPAPFDNDDTMNMYVFGEFRQAKSTQRFDVGSSCNIKNLTTTNNNNNNDTPNNENTNHFSASLANDETTDTSLTFVIYPPRKWKNDVIFPPKMETICLFTVYVINTHLEMCIAVVNSTPFKLERLKSLSSLSSITSTTMTSVPSEDEELEDVELDISTLSSSNNNEKTKPLSNNTTSPLLQAKRMKKIVDLDKNNITTTISNK